MIFHSLQLTWICLSEEMYSEMKGMELLMVDDEFYEKMGFWSNADL